jgi:aminoglycoside 3'-phosphotransferase II
MWNNQPMSKQLDPATLPASLGLSQAQFKPVHLGQSGAGVWQLSKAKEVFAYLKIQTQGRSESLHRDAHILNWLQGQQVPVPAVLNYLEEAGQEFLLMAALPGLPASEPCFQKTPEATVSLLAQALRQLHALPIADCPFDAGLPIKLAQARLHLQAGLVDSSDFEPCFQGLSPDVLFERLWASQPAETDLVFSHGDACLPNFMLTQGGLFTGFIDLGRAGVANRWQDLALLLRSLAHNGYSGLQQAQFLAYYGAEWDAAQYNFYLLLDEFF